MEQEQEPEQKLQCGNRIKKKNKNNNSNTTTTNNNDWTAVSSNSKLKYLPLILAYCPGHACLHLIRKIIGGVQMIDDVVLLVVDHNDPHKQQDNNSKQLKPWAGVIDIIIVNST